jgi:5-methyltetrahydrofolate--homocysteine methyltransferase
MATYGKIKAFLYRTVAAFVDNEKGMVLFLKLEKTSVGGIKMTRQQFREWVNKSIRILDGATGTELQKLGMPLGACPEKWVYDNPDAIKRIQREYIESGSDIIYTCTLGGNGLRLKEFGIDDVVGINRKLAQTSKEAAAGKALVAGDIAPTGQLMEPFGLYRFEEIVNIYKEQVKGLLAGGVDLFVIETMMDIQEARAALLAVKESCSLPVIVTMTFEKGGHTINGTDPLTALVTLQSMGADAVGCNCSTGPKEMLEIIKKLEPYAKVPLVAKPNAGIPKLVDGRTEFDMDADEFASYTQDFVDAGISMLGGCCGTTPEFIRKISRITTGQNSQKSGNMNEALMLSSSRQTVLIDRSLPVCVVGQIHPAERKELQEELKEGSMELVTEYAMEQVDEGALVLNVNAKAEDMDEVKGLTDMVSALTGVVQVPLCLDSSSPEALESALRIYPGRALVNSISCERMKLEKILPIAAKYGAAFILLPVDDDGVTGTAEEKIQRIQKVYHEAEKYGYTKSDFIVGALITSIASDQSAWLETLKVFRWSYDVFCANTIIGLSDISYGLPERGRLNAAFLAMAVSQGLSAALLNPKSDILMHIKRASDALSGKDRNNHHYIETYAGSKKVN